ncbi:MAG: nuclease-related domain-containing protein [bacterium]
MSYSKKIHIRALIFLTFVALVFLIAVTFSAYYSLHDVAKYSIVIFFLMGFAWYPFNVKLVNWIDSLTRPVIDLQIKNVKNGKRGFQGEDEVASWLDGVIEKGDMLRNIVLPNDKFDNDIVIVGNKGVIALEVKNYSNPVHFEDDEYFCEKDGKLLMLSPEKDPRTELRKHAYALRNYLKDNGFSSIALQKALVFSNGKITWKGKIGTFLIRDRESLRNFIVGLDDDPACTSEVCEKIKLLLKG